MHVKLNIRLKLYEIIEKSKVLEISNNIKYNKVIY